MLEKKIAFIGPGVMAEAMIAGLLHKKLAKPENIIAAGPRDERGADLRTGFAGFGRCGKGEVMVALLGGAALMNGSKTEVSCEAGGGGPGIHP